MFSLQDIRADRISKAVYDPFFVFEFENFFQPDTFNDLDDQFPKKFGLLLEREKDSRQQISHG